MSVMYCHRCEKKAVIRMWHHRLNLCKEHYLEWFIAQTQHTIKKYRMFTSHDRVLVAVSGGKDSLSLWDILWQLGYPTEGLYIDLGITTKEGFSYSEKSRKCASDFATQRGLTLHIASLEEIYHKNIIEMSRGSSRGTHKLCGDCGLVKRHVMNEFCKQGQYQAIATGHNLDDEVAVLFGNLYTWQTDRLLRQAPMLEEAQGLGRKVKPLCRFAERETAAYALLRKIPYIYEECPFAASSTSIQYKEWLNQLEEKQPGSKLRFYTGFVKSKDLFSADGQESGAELHDCPICHQATSNPGICSFCKLIHADSA